MCRAAGLAPGATRAGNLINGPQTVQAHFLSVHEYALVAAAAAHCRLATQTVRNTILRHYLMVESHCAAAFVQSSTLAKRRRSVSSGDTFLLGHFFL
jgi:hypothetical protein